VLNPPDLTIEPLPPFEIEPWPEFTLEPLDLGKPCMTPHAYWSCFNGKRVLVVVMGS
jgi:hypothetical protein